MPPASDSQRTEFTVRCACGNTYHSNDSHHGKRIRCRCGRTVVIERPRQRAEEPKAARRHRPHRWSRIRKQLAAARARVRERLSRGTMLLLHDFVHPSRWRRWATRASWTVLLLMLVAWGLLVFASERFLPATLLAYGPRVVILAPIALVAPWALIAARRTWLPLALSTWIALVPIMGARFSLATFGKDMPPAPPPQSIRVLSFNVMVGGRAVALRLNELIATYNPHLIAFQECGEPLFAAMEQLEGWYVHRVHGLCTGSRWPLADANEMQTPERARQALLGGLGTLVRYDIATPHGALVFVNLHLPTARYGLQSLVQNDGGGFVPSNPVEAVGAAARSAAGTLDPNVDAQLRSNRLARDVASERAALRAWNGAPDLPVIVAGDFNLPVESTIYDRHWSHFTNAFEKVGTGLGYSKVEGKLLRVRIDHVLTNGRVLRPVRAHVGDFWGSDHRPVVVDLEVAR